MAFDTDRYYTPSDVALSLLERSSLNTVPSVCVDSTCGSGQLLEAAIKVFGAVTCVGLDNDRQAIARLRRRRPDWRLSVSDLLCPRSFGASLVSKSTSESDLLILNPPFSHCGKKSVDIQFAGQHFKGSLAMFYLLRSFELFDPKQGAIAIVPESLLHSEIDANARSVLARRFSLRTIADLEATTFRGARVHATAVHFDVAEDAKEANPSRLYCSVLAVEAVRGALPIHLARIRRAGMPLLHSTDIRRLVEQKSWDELPMTDISAKGRVCGWSILVPRVGVPSKNSIAPLFIPRTMQLSDCVIALRCHSKQHAERIAHRIRESFDLFLNSYRGTGARFTTMSRLCTTLSALSIKLTMEEKKNSGTAIR
jgi:predicted RNA methylase